MIGRLRIFLSSPGDVSSAREIAARTIETLAQDYARHFRIEPYLWEHEAMLASGHFQDSIEPPSAFDIVVLIVWSRLGTPLPEHTSVRDYRGIDGRVPVSGTEWEYEEALAAARARGAPDLLVYRSRRPAALDTRDPKHREEQFRQIEALDRFWTRHFANEGLFLGAYTGFDSDQAFAEALENHLRKLLDRRVSLAAGAGVPAPVWTHAPFRGLEAYEFEHAPILFGQDEALTKAMVQLAANARAGSAFLLVLGASGSGKSSLVKAGVVPKLFVPRRIPGAAFLRRVVFRPSDAGEGEDLFSALARRLVTAGADGEGLAELISPEVGVADLAAHLRGAVSEPSMPFRTALAGIGAAARSQGRMLAHESARLVLVVDQLEELFAGEKITPDERTRFVGLLAGLARSGLVWVIATMRKDFWRHSDETPQLARLAEGQGRLELLPPTAAQLGQMIRRPAEAAGIAFEVHPASGIALSDVIAEAVARAPGALPLLSYLLDQLYRADVLEARGQTLTFATYERLGRLEGAIATKAEQVLASLAAEDRQALGAVLFALAQMSTAEGDIDRATSRRVPLSAFPEGTSRRRLVDALLDPEARLLVSDAGVDGDATVRVAHEALFTRWDRARAFVSGAAEALKIRRRIEERHGRWRAIEGGGDVSPPPTGPLAKLLASRPFAGRERGLLTELDLADGMRLLRDHRVDLDAPLVDYIQRSLADEKRLRDRSFRALALTAAVLGILLMAASGMAFWALGERDRASRIATVAEDTVSGIIDDMSRSVGARSVPTQSDLRALAERARISVARLTRLTPDGPLLRRLQARDLVRLADTHFHQGDLAAALAAARDAVRIQTALLKADPDDGALRVDLAASERWIGDVRLSRRELPAALAAYEAGLDNLDRAARLPDHDPNLSLLASRAHGAIGRARMEGGDPRGALPDFRNELNLLKETLPARPADPVWLLDLSTAQERIGDALEALNDSKGALAAYQSDLAIRRRLAAQDPGNMLRQRDLSVALEDVGDEQSTLHDLPGAEASYSAALTLEKERAASDPSNSLWQRDLAAGYSDMGDVDAQRGDRRAAADFYAKALPIIAALASKDPSDASLGLDAVTLEFELGDNYARMGDAARAAPHAAAALDNARRLAAEHPGDAKLQDALRQTQDLAKRVGMK